MILGVLTWTAAWGVLTLFAPARPQSQPADPPAPPAMLLADTARTPRVEVSWARTDAEPVRLAGDRGYTSPGAQQSLGNNISAYVAMGGTRLDRAANHPKGAVVRVGLYKTDPAKPFFDGLPDGGTITVTLSGVAMNQPVRPWHATAVMHLKYSKDDLDTCGLGGESQALFHTVSATDDLNGKITSASGRFGSLDGRDPGDGRIELRSESGGTVTMRAEFPYSLLRHIKDPWLRTAPGSFVEPNHFHVEFELLPVSVADAITDPAARPRPYAEKPPPEPMPVGPPG